MLTWMMISGIGLINCWLLYFAFWSARVEGAGAAQADMEMLVYLMSLGSAAVIGSLLILIVGYLTNIKTIKFNASLIRNPVVISSLLNIAVPLLLYAYLLAKR